MILPSISSFIHNPFSVTIARYLLSPEYLFFIMAAAISSASILAAAQVEDELGAAGGLELGEGLAHPPLALRVELAQLDIPNPLPVGSTHLFFSILGELNRARWQKAGFDTWEKWAHSPKKNVFTSLYLTGFFVVYARRRDTSRGCRSADATRSVTSAESVWIASSASKLVIPLVDFCSNKKAENGYTQKQRMDIRQYRKNRNCCHMGKHGVG